LGVWQKQLKQASQKCALKKLQPESKHALIAERILCGVNSFKTNEKTTIEILDVDNTRVREQQLDRLKKLKAERNDTEVTKALDALTEAAKTIPVIY